MAKAINEREIVAAILMEVTENGRYSHIVLREVLTKYQYLEKRERAFITRVTEGTLEHMTEIDYILDCFSKVKVKKMKPLIRAILRSAVYQIKYMDSIPDHAVCSESVKLAVKKGFSGLRGYVNGVLRSVVKGIDEVEYPSDPIKRLSVRYSCPEWIIRLWKETYDLSLIETMLKDFQTEKPTTIRRCRSRITMEQLKKRLEEEHVLVENHPYLKDPKSFIIEKQLKLDGYNTQIEHALELELQKKNVIKNYTQQMHLRMMNIVKVQENKLSMVPEKLRSNMQVLLQNSRHSLQKNCALLDAYSPLKVLSRGYSISKIEDQVIKHVKDVARDDIMVTRVNDGVITSCVVSTKEE